MQRTATLALVLLAALSPVVPAAVAGNGAPGYQISQSTATEFWRMGINSQGGAAYASLSGRYASLMGAFRSSRTSDVYYIFPASSGTRVVEYARFYIVDRSGAYAGDARLMLEVLDFSGAWQHTASDTPIDMQAAATGVWTDVTLSGSATDLEVAPGEVLAFHFALSSAAGNDLDVRPIFEVGLSTGGSAPEDRLIHLPLILKGFRPAPDLVIDNLTVTGGDISLTVRNAGTQATESDFWIDVYFNPDPAPPPLNRPWDSIAPAGAVWGVTRSLAPGESLVLTSGGDYYQADQSSASFPAGAQVYAYVDSINYDTSYGSVLERDEANNVYGPVTSAQGGGTAPALGASTGPPSLERSPNR
jgi:hypothetical protein